MKFSRPKASLVVLICFLSLMLVQTASMAQSAEGNPLDAAPDEFRTNIVKILRTSNKAQTNRYVPLVYEFKHCNPFAVVRFMRRVMEIEEGSWFMFANPEENGGLAVLVAPIYQIPGINDLIRVIDRPGLTTSDGAARAYVQLKHRSTIDQDFLDMVFNEMSLTASSLVPDVDTNALYAKDAPSGIAAFHDYLDVIDVPTPQVRIDLDIYEIDVTNDGTLGLDFMAWKNGPGRNLWAVGAYYETETIWDGDAVVYDSGAGTTGLPGHGFRNKGHNSTYLLDVPSSFFDFLVVKGTAKLLTSTQLTAMSGETASFATGEQIPYYLVQNGEAPTAGLRTNGQFIDPYGTNPLFPDNRTLSGATLGRQLGAVETGVFLDIAPMIGTEMINLSITGSVVSLLGYDENGVPKLGSREFSSDIRLTDGEQIVLGGMNRTSEIKSVQKIPILGSLPVLGFLFGKEITTVHKTTVVSVVTATIVSDFNNASDASETVIAIVDDGAPVEDLAVSAGFDQFLLDAER